ncbi:MAG: alpha/beta hydrolase [Panacibacter sp.]
MKNAERNIVIIALLFLIAGCSSPVKEQAVNISNGNVNIAYIKEGNSDTAIVFVHGWCINKEYWQQQINYFSKRYITVALDLGGHGQSGLNRDSFRIEDYAADVTATINELNLKKVILVGHSMGGDIILEVANNIPEKIIGFIGIDNLKDVSVGFTAEQQKQIDDFMSALKKNFDTVASAYCRGALFPPNYTDTIPVNRVIKSVQDIDSTVAIKSLQSVINISSKESSMIAKLKIPVHLIVSDYTPMNEADVKKYCKAGLYVKTIHGTGHYPMIEKPREFNELLRQTLNEIAAGK